MGAVVELSALKAVVNTSRPTADLAIFVDTGVSVTNELLVGANFADDKLSRIALYLAAHFYSVTYERGGVKSLKVGQSEDTYNAADKTLVGFMSTRYGQQACAFDTSGTLAAASQKVAAQFYFKSGGFGGGVGAGAGRGSVPC